MMKKRFLNIILIISLLLPVNIYAYSNRVIVGGETIGIEVYSKGLYVVGFYNVNGSMIASDAGFKVGDIVEEINDKKVSSINDINSIIKDDGVYIFSIRRNNNKKSINLELKSTSGTIKTGLYVKDKINGIGTLSYIDPETKIFASLGHEILESNSMSKFDISSGNIYKAEVTTIKKSERGVPGEKHANIVYDDTIGEVSSNEINGIYGKYLENFDDKNTMDVGTMEEIKSGRAVIRTVVSNESVEEFSINIITVDESDPVKNIFFEITDEKLIDMTNGIIQGMSGSPIIQNNKIIGVVNYVVLDDSKKGYGIFIETMLEEGDKIK